MWHPTRRTRHEETYQRVRDHGLDELQVARERERRAQRARADEREERQLAHWHAVALRVQVADEVEDDARVRRVCFVGRHAGDVQGDTVPLVEEKRFEMHRRLPLINEAERAVGVSLKFPTLDSFVELVSLVSSPFMQTALDPARCTVCNDAVSITLPGNRIARAFAFSNQGDVP